MQYKTKMKNKKIAHVPSFPQILQLRAREHQIFQPGMRDQRARREGSQSATQQNSTIKSVVALNESHKTGKVIQ